MPFMTTRDGVDLYYSDWGQGRPVILIHGWPLDSSMWAHQAVFLAERGFRVIAYDRRGFGRSERPWNGHDYDTLSDDLAAFMDGLDLRDAGLVGFSMGGGEVARYLRRHGSGRVSRAVLVASVTPFLVRTEGSPDGIERAEFDTMMSGLLEDRPAFLADFAMAFFGNGLLTSNVSQETVQWACQVAMGASLRSTIECAKAYANTDFRRDMAAFDVPTLILHGTADETVPIECSARVTAQLVPEAQFVEYDGEPHGLFATAKNRLSRDLLTFLS